MPDNSPADKPAQSVPDAKLHKGYLWVLVVVLIGGAWVYFSNETRNMDGGQKFYFWALDGQYTQQVKDFADRHTLKQLEALCRSASEVQNTPSGALLIEEEVKPAEPGLLKKAIQKNTTDVCNAYIYKLKRTKIEEGDLEGITF